MVLSFASLTNEIVKPLIIVKAAFVLVSLLLRRKLRADWVLTKCEAARRARHRARRARHARHTKNRKKF